MLPLFLLFLSLSPHVHAAQNVTTLATSNKFSFKGSWENIELNTAPWCEGLSEGWKQTREHGSSVSLSFVGTEIDWYGEVFGDGGWVSLQLSLDGVTSTRDAVSHSGCGPLFSESGLENTSHNITVTLLDANPQAVLAFYSTNHTTSSEPSDTTSNSFYDNLRSSCCGSTSKCSYRPEEQLGTTQYRVIVGSPVENCHPGSTESMTTEIGGSISITDSWSQVFELGIGPPGLQISGGGGWQQTKERRLEQKIGITIKPGMKAAIVARPQFSASNGTLKLRDSGSTSRDVSVYSLQPLGSIPYDQEVVPCGQDFTALYVEESLPCSLGWRIGLNLSLVIGSVIIYLCQFLAPI